jgi:cytochrome bd-type quinol oxidase subunit 1
VSPNVPAWNIIFSLVAMTVLYSFLTLVALKLGVKYGTSDFKAEEISAADPAATD